MKHSIQFSVHLPGSEIYTQMLHLILLHFQTDLKLFTVNTSCKFCIKTGKLAVAHQKIHFQQLAKTSLPGTSKLYTILKA